ncbi:MAG: hypothetical protein ABJC09_14150 [Terriglobia bacterium]
MLVRSGLLALIGVIHCAGQTPPLQLRVSTPIVPAGGTAQIRIYTGSAVSLVNGELRFDFDPAIFGPVAAADLFSSTGDQLGTADIRDRHVNVKFQSPSGGLGRLPDLPVIALRVPVLASATVGSVGRITVTSGPDPWLDLQNVHWSAAALAGSVTVGGSLSIAGLTPGGGLLPPGTPIRLTGVGFTAATTVNVESAIIAKTEYVSASELVFTMTTATDLTGKLVTVSSPDGSSATFVSAFQGIPVPPLPTGGFGSVQPIFPLQLYPAGSAGSVVFSTAAIALRNPGLQSIDVILKTLAPLSNGSLVTGFKVTLPPGGVYIAPVAALGGGTRARAFVVPSAPIQMMLIDPSGSATAMAPLPDPVLQPFLVTKAKGNVLDSGAPWVWNWKISGTLPSPVKLQAILEDFPAPFVIGVQSEGGWLKVAPASGTTCNTLSNPGTYQCPDSADITVSVDPSKLSPGTYNGTLSLSAGVFGAVPDIVPVVLNVSAESLLFVNQDPATTIDFGPQLATAPPLSVLLTLTSNADPAAFSADVQTQSGRPWLTVSPAAGVTPATLTIRADPAALAASEDTGTVTVKGGANNLVFRAAMQTLRPETLGFDFRPVTISFVAGVRESAPPSQQLSFRALIAASPVTVTSQTADGGKWLSVSVNTSPGVPYIAVAVDKTGLSPGTYRGTINVTSTLTGTSGQVPVTLLVWSEPPPIVLDPAVLNFSTTVGSGATQIVRISTGNLPLLFDLRASAGWLGASLTFTPFVQVPTPTTFEAFVNTVNLEPGVYKGSFMITAPPQSSNTALLPVTLTVDPRLDPPPSTVTLPLVALVANSASQRLAGLSPGEIISIFGQNIGPPAPAGFTIGADGRIPTQLSGEQVLFDGMPAPLIYTSAGLINLIVPYEVGAREFTALEIQYDGVKIPVGTFPVVPAAPGIFALDATGRGQGAVLNGDNTLNGAANAAARGSVIQIYATGEGLLSPAGMTGEITGANLKRPLLRVKVSIGGVDALVQYAGTVPTAVAGLLQLNVVVPATVAPGPSVPVLLSVGEASSSDSVTIAVR